MRLWKPAGLEAAGNQPAERAPSHAFHGAERRFTRSVSIDTSVITDFKQPISVSRLHMPECRRKGHLALV